MTTTRFSSKQVSDSHSCVTVDAFAQALDLNCAGYREKLILVKRRRRTPLQAGGACKAPPHKDGNRLADQSLS
jgi:hypothetical protein